MPASVKAILVHPRRPHAHVVGLREGVLQFEQLLLCREQPLHEFLRVSLQIIYHLVLLLNHFLERAYCALSFRRLRPKHLHLLRGLIKRVT